MNRYIADGICRDLAEGKRVGLVALTRRCSRATFNLVAETIGDEAERVIKADGRELIITASGGELRIFTLSPSGLRGVSLDVLVIPDRDAIPYDRMMRLLDDIRAISATRHLDVIAN